MELALCSNCPIWCVYEDFNCCLQIICQSISEWMESKRLGNLVYLKWIAAVLLLVQIKLLMTTLDPKIVIGRRPSQLEKLFAWEKGQNLTCDSNIYFPRKHLFPEGEKFFTDLKGSTATLRPNPIEGWEALWLKVVSTRHVIYFCKAREFYENKVRQKTDSYMSNFNQLRTKP